MFGKAVLLAIYLLAVVSACSGVIPGGIWLQWVAVILLVAHALEVLVAWGSIRKYQGPVIDSVALTLLFGFLHWLPLKKSAG